MKGKLLDFTDTFLPNPISLFIPISIRPLNDQSMRNWSTGAIAYLPVGHGMPTSIKAMYARLHANRKRLSIVKNSLLPKFFFWLVAITGQTPILYPSSQWTPVKSIVEFVYANVLSSFTAVLTNVPGPQGDPITLEGHQVRRWTALPPQAGKGTLGIGIISYANTIAISISADQVPASAGVARRITAKFERRWQQVSQSASEHNCTDTDIDCAFLPSTSMQLMRFWERPSEKASVYPPNCPCNLSAMLHEPFTVGEVLDHARRTRLDCTSTTSSTAPSSSSSMAIPLADRLPEAL